MRTQKNRELVIPASTAALLLACLLLAALPRAAKSEDKPPAKGDKEAIQGTWKVASHVVKGNDSKPEGDPVKIRFEGDTCYQVKGDEKADPADIKLDPDKDPKQIDISPTTGPDKGSVFKGIYELNGDTLKLCIAHDGDRPAAFKADDKEHAVLVLERDK